MERIKGGTMERVASNCYGNWNFANKYFSIACFSNKLINSFCYLALLLSPRPPFFSVHSFPSYLGMNGKVLLFDPSSLSRKLLNSTAERLELSAPLCRARPLPGWVVAAWGPAAWLAAPRTLGSFHSVLSSNQVSVRSSRPGALGTSSRGRVPWQKGLVPTLSASCRLSPVREPGGEGPTWL